MTDFDLTKITFNDLIQKILKLEDKVEKLERNINYLESEVKYQCHD